MSVSPLIICVIHCVLIASTLTVPLNVVASLVSKATASTAHVSALNYNNLLQNFCDRFVSV